MNKIFFLLGLVCLVSNTALARKGFVATQFQVGGMRITPEQFPSSAFVHVGWTPLYKIKQGGIRGELGATGPRNSLEQRFLSTNYGVFAYYVLFSLVAVEGGAGFQSWFGDNGGTHPLLSANVVLLLEGDFIDRLVMGYSRYFADNGANQFYSGIGFRI